MIKTRLGAQRYNRRMERIWENAKRLQKIYSADVIIEVRGGVAEITRQPENITVSIIDHDNSER